MPLSIGIAGLSRGLSHLEVFSNRDDCEVVAVCDVDAEKATTIAQQHDIANAFESYDALVDFAPDVIVVATPAPLHAEHCIAALDAGINVLSEVPAVYSIEEGRQLAEAVERSSATYSFAENMCYVAYMQTYEHIIRSGQLGKVYYAEAEYVHDCRFLFGTPENPTWRVSMPPIYYCTHDLGPLLWWTDDRVATAVGMHTGSNVDPDWDCIDAEVGLFQTEKGAVMKFLASFCTARRPWLHGMVIHGTEGVLEAPRCGWDKHKAFLPSIPNSHDMVALQIDWIHPEAPEGAEAAGHGTAEYYMIEDFVRCILEDTPPPFDVYTALDLTLPGICAHESAIQGGQPVEVPNFRPS